MSDFFADTIIGPGFNPVDLGKPIQYLVLPRDMHKCRWIYLNASMKNIQEIGKPTKLLSEPFWSF